jgi:hypothetical protein
MSVWFYVAIALWITHAGAIHVVMSDEPKEDRPGVVDTLLWPVTQIFLLIIVLIFGIPTDDEQ